MNSSALSVITDLVFCNNIPIFVIENDTDMETSIIRIGNSRGIIIPASILKKMNVDKGDKVKLEENGEGKFTLSFIPTEEPFTGPFTGPFKPLAKFKDIEDPWGDDPSEYVRQLRDSRGKERRIIPDL